MMDLKPYQGQWQRIYLELTNACNCSCEFCPRPAMTRPIQHMNLGLAKRLLSEIRALGIASKVVFHVMGEPTLHPHCLDILDFAIQLGLHSSLVTNGMALQGKLGRQFAQRPLDEITLSIQTPDATSYTHRHAPLGFHAYRRTVGDFLGQAYLTLTNTRFFLRFLNTFLYEKIHCQPSLYGGVCSRFPALRTALIDWARNLLQILEIPSHSREAALAQLSQLRLERWSRIEICERLQFDIWPMLAWRDWSKVSPVSEVDTGNCVHHRDHFAVLSNGDVVLCCMDFNGHTALGNVCDRLLMNVLQDEPAQQVFHAFSQGRIALSFCRRCLGSWHRTLGELHTGKSILATQQAIARTLQSQCRLWG